ncbi:sulfotransferase 6B1 [Anolis carolinensis]|uniref:Sulfotransferase n=1 Tax=Anolis carolinensis TaxID=28377 RepID=R4GCL6_ANOCA|nr:PREDICTED: sulfotransferase 6B1 [Anolis carolinensis]XP_016854846.1 PREDICTED: sulfotransferase 6B1 [Anolis carolinensis]|eukprot:XP_003215878.1 PREDICTED: sulfotransferase 6B1 [Anolis carolinensis]
MAYVRNKFIEAVEKAMEAGKKMTPEQKLFTYDGVVYPTTLCSPEVFRALESFEARSDDVILDGYCKCGNNWVGQIVTDLVATSAKKHEPHKFNKELLLAEMPFLEIGDPEKYQRMKSYPSRRVIFSHLRPDKFPVSVFKNKAKVLMLIRNPKDVAASFFHFSNTFTAYPPYDTFGAFFEDLMKGQVPWGSYIDFLCMWNKYIDEENVMPITYEEMKENTVLGAEKIAKFLELNLSEEDIQGVAKRSTFTAMKDNSKTTHGEFGNALFRKGSVSDWKALFSQENNQEMDTVFREHLAGTKVGALIKYDVYCKV